LQIVLALTCDTSKCRGLFHIKNIPIGPSLCRGYEGSIATVGITHHAQEALGEIVFVELPMIGKVLERGDTFGVVESIKAVSDLFSPVSGEVLAINTNAINDPSVNNKDAYAKGWMVKIQMNNAEELLSLLDASAYENLVSSL
jgi:glycine cleavage system H protein